MGANNQDPSQVWILIYRLRPAPQKRHTTRGCSAQRPRLVTLSSRPTCLQPILMPTPASMSTLTTAHYAGTYLAVFTVETNLAQVDVDGWLYPNGWFSVSTTPSNGKILVAFEITAYAYLVILPSSSNRRRPISTC